MRNEYRVLLLAAASMMVCSFSFAEKKFTLKAPDGQLQVDITIDKTIEYSVTQGSDLLISPSPISMTLTNGQAFGIDPKFQKKSTRSVNQTIAPPVYKRAEIKDEFNELALKFKGDYTLIFRAYNEGVAYRFVSTSSKGFEVQSEQASFRFPADAQAFVPYVKGRTDAGFEAQFFNSFENTYEHIPLSKWDSKRLTFLPLLVEGPNGKKVLITESDLLNYPGMYLHNPDGSPGLQGVFAPYPKEIEQGGHNRLQGVVKSREAYLAKYDKGTSFPWRVIVVSEKDRELADNDLVYKLASPATFTDIAWIKPGKVAWDWWNDWNLYHVDFRTGVNNETYKYYIDFASAHGIEYVILDEGWSVNLQADLMQVVPEINLPELVRYADSKKVGLILWAGYLAFDRDLEKVCKHYSEMGIKGFKVDFMDRDDQAMVNFHRRAAETAAKYHLMLDFHGTYKPTGLHRTYPNVINYEGVHGLETMKWSPGSVDQVTYDVTIPFIRMAAGPFDYTQGAMRNATKNNYYPCNSEPMSQGTRCRQLAEYIVFESPLNMLCDNPSNYMAEKECLEFIASVPTTWDQTVSLDGEVSKYIAIARKKGNDWYVGALTNWDARTLELDLSFLGEGSYRAEIFRDGINADRVARDYVKEEISIPASGKLSVKLAPGGGCVLKITKGNS
ncbi:glycoside hydrolase family 97 protein [Parabacteroides sp. Marseille-P3160]|uniref:glycoside hydrolase family 97 protein n=1 Tax=Parabacteroides sp. Marseille-P3160 TaxID=1917887 RepID=UPI0009BC0017|nr:glycoside hydrolase family 97 protein [Parabacteroides sp. Marseille-P3160]